MKEAHSTQVVEKNQGVSTSVPNLGNIQEDLHSAVAILDSAVAKLESLPKNHGRAIWKNIIVTVREDINRSAIKLVDVISGTSTDGKP